MRQVLIEFTLSLVLSWTGMFAVSSCVLSQSVALHAIAGGVR